MGLPATRISGRRMPSLPWLVYLTEQLSARADRDVAGEPVTGGGHKDRAGLSRLAKLCAKALGLPKKSHPPRGRTVPRS